MKKSQVLVNTRKGNMYVKGYVLGNGLYLHRLITHTGTFIHSQTHAITDSYEVLDTTKSNYWTITHGKSGMAVREFSYKPMKLKEVINEASKVSHLDWNKNSEELNNEIYRNAVSKMNVL